MPLVCFVNPDEDPTENSKPRPASIGSMQLPARQSQCSYEDIEGLGRRVVFQVRSCFVEGFTMKEKLRAQVRRRDLLRSMMASVAVAATSTVALKPTSAETTAATETRTSGDKRKARYQASSAEVQDFYRVNRYPAK